jgi:membrane-associated phospholipid phosphatase
MASSSARHAWLRIVGLLAATWLLLCAVVVGWGWLLTQHLESSVGAVDDDVSRWFASERTADLSSVAEVGTLLGETVVGAVALVLIASGFALWRRSWRPLVLVVLVEAGIGGIYALGTHLDPRDRPPVRILDAGLVPDASFPSGHVGTATALAACAAALIWAFTRASHWWAVPLAAVPLSCLLARLYQGAHHPTDVLTSLTYTLVWVAVVARLVLRRDDA